MRGIATPWKTVGVFLYRPDCELLGTLHNVPAHTEARIMALVSQALAAESEADIDRVLPDLREALSEHVRLAKESLEARIVLLPKERAGS